MAGGVGGAGVAALVEDQAREADHGRGGLTGIALEIGERRHRVVVEVEGAGVDEVDEGLPGQPEAHDRVVEGGGDGIAADVAARLALQRVAPPLQPYLAEGGFRDAVADARDLEAEGVEREQERALAARREQGGEEAVRVAGPHESFAVGEGP